MREWAGRAPASICGPASQAHVSRSSSEAQVRWLKLLIMPDLILILVLVAAIFLLADLFLAGGAMTMTGMSAMTTVVAHPLAAGALVVLVIVLALVLGGQT